MMDTTFLCTFCSVGAFDDQISRDHHLAEAHPQEHIQIKISKLLEQVAEEEHDHEKQREAVRRNRILEERRQEELDRAHVIRELKALQVERKQNEDLIKVLVDQGTAPLRKRNLDVDKQLANLESHLDREFEKDFVHGYTTELALSGEETSHPERERQVITWARTLYSHIRTRCASAHEGLRVFWEVFREEALSNVEREATVSRTYWRQKQQWYRDSTNMSPMVSLIDMALRYAKIQAAGRCPLQEHPDMVNVHFSEESGLAPMSLAKLDLMAHEPSDPGNRADKDRAWYTEDLIADILHTYKPFAGNLRLVEPRVAQEHWTFYAEGGEHLLTEFFNMIAKVIQHFGFPSHTNRHEIDSKWWSENSTEGLSNFQCWDHTDKLLELLRDLKILDFDPERYAGPLVLILSSNSHFIAATIDPTTDHTGTGLCSTYNSWPDVFESGPKKGQRAIGSLGPNQVLAFAKVLSEFPVAMEKGWPSRWRHVEVDQVTRQADGWSCGSHATDNAQILLQGQIPQRFFGNEQQIQDYSRRLRRMHLDRISALVTDCEPNVHVPTIPRLEMPDLNAFVDTYEKRLAEEKESRRIAADEAAKRKQDASRPHDYYEKQIAALEAAEAAEKAAAATEDDMFEYSD